MNHDRQDARRDRAIRKGAEPQTARKQDDPFALGRVTAASVAAGAATGSSSLGGGLGAPIAMRNDISLMLLPVFVDGPGPIDAEFDGHRLRVYVEGDDGRMASPTDRKILNFLAGAIAARIRSGQAGSRHIRIETRPLIEALRADGVVGGAEYERLIASLKRLMGTVIETTMPLGDGVSRERRFRWVDAYEHDNHTTSGGKSILSLQITLSDDAFMWMTRTLGFEVAQPEFAAVTASRSSAWRIYEICFAQLIQAKSATSAIHIDDLRRRVPISAPLKVFKSRTLRTAMETIAATPEMNAHIRLLLERRTPKGFEEVDFAKRVSHDDLFVRIMRGRRAWPAMNVLLSQADAVTALARA
ncbi:replication initiator protein A [Rubrimonas cliftonensis]|nr:replication initiator protein A [Rubrimonas cliftonensis]